MQSPECSGEKEILRLERDEALALALPPHSRFMTYQLAQHVAEHPDMAYRVRGAMEYILGGFWRRRPEIGAILELMAVAAREALLATLLKAYQARGCALVVLDPREQERNLRFYRQQGFTVIETLIQLERRGIRVAEQPRGITIRAMETGDLAAVLDVEQHSFPWFWWNSASELLWYAGVPGVELYVALAADQPERVAGYAGITVFDQEAHLDRLAVHSDYQGRGYAAALLAFVMRRMSELGARRVALSTQLDNRRSQSLYKRFGFHKSGWQHDVLGLWLSPGAGR